MGFVVFDSFQNPTNPFCRQFLRIRSPQIHRFYLHDLERMASSQSWCPLQYNEDIVAEVLKHLDAKSLAMASCVNNQWKRAAETESLWQSICRKQWPAAGESQKMRSVVIALGGYRRFFVVCLRPLLYRSLPTRSRACNHDGFIPLSLSLFSMDCYERLGRNKHYLQDDEPRQKFDVAHC